VERKRGVGTEPKQNSGPGRMAQTPGAGTGDSLGRFCRYRCSTRFNYDSNLSICGTLLKKLLPFPDNRELLPIPQETSDLNLNALL